MKTDDEQSETPDRAGAYGWLGHHDGDDVAVAVADLEPGEVAGAFSDSGRELAITVTDQVPLGHKIALRDLPEGQEVTEYGVRIGITSQAVTTGAHVHVHNLRSARWSRS